MEKEYKKLYSRAREFLIAELGRSAELDRSDAESILNEYARPSNPQLDNCNISDVYKAILASAQNTNMKPAVIKAAIGEFDALSKVLFNFDLENYGKPDVHVIDILVDLDFCKEDASLYSIQKTIFAVAKANEITTYCLDKILWLIGSGKFYRHPDTEDNKGQEKKYINIWGKKGEFIKYYKELRGVSGAA